MRVTLPLLRIPAARAPILRYGVAVLSTALALIPTILLADVSESRLALFGVAVMVSAWYGGWKPGLVATSFALTVLLAQCGLACGAGEFAPFRAELPVAGNQRTLWHLPLRFRWQNS